MRSALVRVAELRGPGDGRLLHRDFRVSGADLRAIASVPGHRNLLSPRRGGETSRALCRPVSL